MLPFLGILAIQKTSFFQHVAMRCHSPVFTSLGFYALHSLRTIPSVSRSQPERATVTILQNNPRQYKFNTRHCDAVTQSLVTLRV